VRRGQCSPTHTHTFARVLLALVIHLFMCTQISTHVCGVYRSESNVYIIISERGRASVCVGILPC
jgi:hypothetical protein